MSSNLTYSIFYNKTDWFRFLIWIKNYDMPNEINAFFLKMSSVGGDHIELTINVKNKNRIKIAKVVSDCFLNFLKKSRSSPIYFKQNNESYYLDFPNNTIHYGVHDYQLNEKEILLHYKLANIIISIFCEYKAETLNTLTEIMIQAFVIYSQFSSKNINELILYFQDLISFESFKYDKTLFLKQQRKDLDKFHQNRVALVDYLEESIFKKRNFPKNGWEKNLFDLYKLSNLSKQSSPEQILQRLYENIGYESLTALILMVEGLKALKNS